MATFPNPRMPSNMQHTFSRVPTLDIPRSVFDRSRTYKTTFDSGYLIPFFADEVLPGDTMDLKMHALVRLTTPIVPIMDNIWLDVHFFVIPNRILWSHWVNFMGEQENPDDSTDYVTPKITFAAGNSEGSIYDYMGVQIGAAGNTIHNFFGRAYNQTYNRWYRDQNLIDSVPVDLDDGPDDIADYVLLKRGKRHDYFTSCLPFPQKGPAVDIPLGTSAPIKTDGTLQGDVVSVLNSADAEFGLYSSTGTNNIRLNTAIAANPLYADLTDATAATINQLRQAFQVQGIYEIDARGGTRYPEMILAHFGVQNPDFRMQYPEYIGGASYPMNVAALAQTSATDTGTPLGELAGVASANINGAGFRHSFTEHAVVLGLISARADLTYQQGTHRMFYRDTRFDYYFPALAHLGEQTVLNREIFTQGTAGAGADEGVFGYQERFAEYRYGQSLITGKMRSDAAASLDIWHLSQDFSALPELNAEFINEDPPVSRVVAVDTEPQFRLDAWLKIKHIRPMPVYSVPGLISPGGRVL